MAVSSSEMTERKYTRLGNQCGYLEAKALSALVVLMLLAAGCSEDSSVGSPASVGDEDVLSAIDIASEEDIAPMDIVEADDTSPPAEPDVVEPEVALCPDGLPQVPFSTETPGLLRHDLAGDFAFTRMDGVPWQLSKRWTGCDVYVFIPDTISNSALDNTSIWERDVLELIQASPPNVHYFFVSRRPGATGSASLEAMNERIAKAIQNLPQAEADEWWYRMHVVNEPVQTLDTWFGNVMAGGIGMVGFSIDRNQRIRGIGSFSDVERYSSALAAAEQFPWESNLSYAAHDALFLNAHAKMIHERDLKPSTEVVLFDGEVVEQFADATVQLPSAEEMAAYDTFEIEIDMRCPDPTMPEVGNCGAWDYLAHFYLMEPPPADAEPDAGPTRIELGRFITTYHREAHWVHDVTAMIVPLLDGGERTFRWEWAPSWNKQPTETRVKLRMRNEGRELQPFASAELYRGASFNAEYNDQFEPLEVAVPEDAVKVELYSVITGHGADFAQCAEFCNHEHHWTINGETFIEDHPAVGQEKGCVSELDSGMTPNQWGSWWFGRGGWCPGQAVYPWTVDLTDIAAPGTMASIEYRGLLGGQPVTTGAGNIVMTSYLVFYK